MTISLLRPPDLTNNLRLEGFSLAHSFEATVPPWLGSESSSMAAKLEVDTHTAAAVRKQRMGAIVFFCLLSPFRLA